MGWGAAFETGVRTIDDEHRELVAILNEFHSALEHNLGESVAFATLNRLIRYAEKHFSDEEALMAKARYPGLKDHIAEHERLMAQVFELHTKLMNREATFSTELFNFLREWLIDHILNADMDFGRFVMGG